MRRRTPTIARLLKKTVETAAGCWVFTGSTGTHGYGRIYDSDRGKPVQAHGVTYRYFVSDVPAGLALDHLCRNRACVNPWHLDPVPTRVNTLRGLAPLVNGAHNAIKTHCPSGHPYDATNTRRTPEGWRYCIQCKREKQRKNCATTEGATAA